MKKIFTSILIITILSCNSGNKANNDAEKDNASTTKTETERGAELDIVSKFLVDTKTLESIKDKNPISLFQKLAETKASEVLTISKDNIKAVLSSAKEYRNCIIITGDHTIVKVTNISNCKPSASWGVCMPFAGGYIKKGELVFKEDYMNNIIGIPDSQVRKAYLFN